MRADCNEPTVEVPMVAMQAIALLLSGDLSATNWGTLRRSLRAAGCIEELVDSYGGYAYRVVGTD